MCTFRIGRRHLRIYRCKVASENDRRSEVESGGGGKEGGSSGKVSESSNRPSLVRWLQQWAMGLDQRCVVGDVEAYRCGRKRGGEQKQKTEVRHGSRCT